MLAFDIGGANVKVAHSSGVAMVHPFELWKRPAELRIVLQSLLNSMPAYDTVAMTMTGELCDCFSTRSEGVCFILDAIEGLAAGRIVGVWLLDGRFGDMAAARAQPLTAAASNWLALASYVGRYAPNGTALLIDVGSTTTDIIPLVDGCPEPTAHSDRERLLTRELVYTGAARTPVCALLGGDGAAEFFATTLDINLILGHVAEDATNCQTADGRPAVREAAMARVARMECADLETMSVNRVYALAARIFERQAGLIGDAIGTVCSRLPSPVQTIIFAGSGEFLGRHAVASVSACAAAERICLSDRLGRVQSDAACAYAVAILFKEQLISG